MKDIYEYLNDIEIDTDLDELTPVSEFEKKKVMKELNRRIVTEKKQNKWKKALTVAMVTFGIMITSIAGLSLTTFAQDIPFLGNIFAYFSSDNSYVGYDEQAEKMDLVQESNGIKISVNDSVFDGKALYVTYTIETDKDLGASPWLSSLPMYGDTGMGGAERISKVDVGKYVGITEAEHYHPYELDEIDVNWNIDHLSSLPNREGIVYEGNWNFQFSLDAVANENIVIEEKISESGIEFIAEKIVITPMSFLLSYSQGVEYSILNAWDSQSVRVEVKDDLGNNYHSLSASGTGRGTIAVPVNWTATYNQLDPDASKLILTPIVELSDYETIGYHKNGEPIKATYRNIDSDADYEEIQLEDIIVELK